MAWPMFYGKHDENTRTAWGYSFQWTPEHQTREQLSPMKHSYDVLGEDALNALDIISPSISKELPRNKSRVPEKPKEPNFTPKRDLYALLRNHHTEDEALDKLWSQVNTIPDWVDWVQIERGQKVFYRYGEVALTALTYQSLLGGMGANRIVETLARTGGFGVKVARHRMFETTQHILQCTRSLESIKPGGEGFASSIRVRLLHSAVRRRIMKLAKDRPDYYNVKEFGVPINDLDSIGTIASFSTTLIYLGFPRQGIFLREQEIVDYLALWRLIAHFVGTPTDYFETPEKARTIMDSILLSEVDPNETSKALANNIILALEGTAPGYASRDFLAANARWLNGTDLADALGIANPSLYYKALTAAQCLLFMVICYTYRSIPYLDQRKIKKFRKLFYHIVVENEKNGLGKETVFDFKYIPDFHTTTTMGDTTASGLKIQGIERRNFWTLSVAGGIVGVVSWYSVKLSLGTFSKVIG